MTQNVKLERIRHRRTLQSINALKRAAEAVERMKQALMDGEHLDYIIVMGCSENQLVRVVTAMMPSGQALMRLHMDIANDDVQEDMHARAAQLISGSRGRQNDDDDGDDDDEDGEEDENPATHGTVGNA